ncbi:MAG: APC family permease [Candidatus Margulisiibacteriota bacterium]
MTRFFQALKRLVVGKARNPFDQQTFHHLSLIAFFAWVGLGADGLSSSVYGPAEAFMTLHQHPYLAIFVGLASVLTIFVISSCYNQIIELFPSGGGGYLVASRLLSPTMGMISGCALIIDYVLTITISVASGADAVFSFLPAHLYHYKLAFAVFGVLLLSILNLRGAKESVVPLVPVFIVFVLTHTFVILYALFGHLGNIPAMVHATAADVSATRASVGLLGTFLMLLKAYSMGAGTYTGIEAVSNGVSILREPRVKTARRTMQYMAASLSFMVMGLLLAYIFFNVSPAYGKTLNAILLENVTQGWPAHWGYAFFLTTLVSEVAILFVAAQTGFIDGPRVIANMAIDRWFPTKFAMLSDRLITQNGILIMGAAAIVTMFLTRGEVGFLVVLYSINVFLTFVLSLGGMTKHWWESRFKVKRWKSKILLSGVGLILSSFILVSMIVLKFHDGGWITLFVTGLLIVFVLLIKRHYLGTALLLKKLDKVIAASNLPDFIPTVNVGAPLPCDTQAKTAVLFVNGFSGLGLYTLRSIGNLFSGVFKNIIFVQVSLIDAGVFKGFEELERLQTKSGKEVNRYVELSQQFGYYAEGISVMAVDVADEMTKISDHIIKRFPNAVFFGGKLVFPEDTFLTQWLHNSMVLSIQRNLYRRGIPFVILPVKVE